MTRRQDPLLDRVERLIADEQAARERLGYGTRPDHPWNTTFKRACAPEVSQPEGACSEQVFADVESIG